MEITIETIGTVTTMVVVEVRAEHGAGRTAR
jgi:hypothetical protein